MIATAVAAERMAFIVLLLSVRSTGYGPFAMAGP
jgi:hypothetical protein